MVTDELLRRFEAGDIDAGWFDHRAHLRVTFEYLKRKPVHEVLRYLSSQFQHIATSHGQPNRYHETVTWAFVLIVNDRMSKAPAEDFEAFAKRNPDLLERGREVLARYYPAEVLESERARTSFVWPATASRPADVTPPSHSPSHRSS